MAGESPKEASTADFAEYETKQASVFDANFRALDDPQRCSSYEAQYQSLITQDDPGQGPGTSPPRKRNKIDKDGFVTPLTPDIRKLSSDETERRSGTHHSTTHGHQEHEEGAGKKPQLDGDFVTSDKSYAHPSGSHAEESASDKISLPFSQHFAGINEKTTKELEHWEKCFVDSENYEAFCLTRLDSLLAEAQALEINLTEQKEQLRQRLATLSQTLMIASGHADEN